MLWKNVKWHEGGNIVGGLYHVDFIAIRHGGNDDNWIFACKEKLVVGNIVPFEEWVTYDDVSRLFGAAFNVSIEFAENGMLMITGEDGKQECLQDDKEDKECVCGVLVCHRISDDTMKKFEKKVRLSFEKVAPGIYGLNGSIFGCRVCIMRVDELEGLPQNNG